MFPFINSSFENNLRFFSNVGALYKINKIYRGSLLTGKPEVTADLLFLESGKSAKRNLKNCLDDVESFPEEVSSQLSRLV